MLAPSQFYSTGIPNLLHVVLSAITLRQSFASTDRAWRRLDSHWQSGCDAFRSYPRLKNQILVMSATVAKSHVRSVALGTKLRSLLKDSSASREPWFFNQFPIVMLAALMRVIRFAADATRRLWLTVICPKMVAARFAQDKIRVNIPVSYLVLVMNLFGTRQISSKARFDYKAMFKHMTRFVSIWMSRHLNLYIAIAGWNRSRFSLVDNEWGWHRDDNAIACIGEQGVLCD